MVGKGKKGKTKIGPGPVSIRDGIPVGELSIALVGAISTHVTHCDNFSPCITWSEHKDAHRVDKLFDNLKGPWSLPDNKEARKWFNVKARNRWSDFKTRTLKPYFDNAEGDLQKAIAKRPVKHINEPMWEMLCKQFAGINDPGEDPNGKSKSQKCKEARGANNMNHFLGRTSLENWVDEHIQVLGKPPNVGVVFDKAYLRIDPLQPRSSQSDEGEEGSHGDHNTNSNDHTIESNEAGD